MRVALALAWALILAACTTPGPPEPTRPGATKPATVTQKINLSGYPPEFRKGFSEGCAAARGENKAARPKGETQFAAGWGDGYDYCKPKK